MRIQEMKEREDFEEVFAETLRGGLSARYGDDFDVDFRQPRQGQRWRLHSTFNAYVTSWPGRSVRRYLRDSLRYTRIFHRLPLQFAYAVAMAGRLGLWLGSTEAFSLRPALPHPRQQVLIPGNQRVRLFDFANRRALVMLKEGFDPRTMRTEIERRLDQRTPLAPPLLEHDPQGRWLEEPILDALPLARLAPWAPYDRLARESLAKLDAWTVETASSVEVATYAQDQVTIIVEGLEETRQRYELAGVEDMLELVGRLQDVSAKLDEISVGMTHGDFQPGNVMASRDGEHLYIIDWEHAAPRSQYYDRLVFGLSSRNASGIAERIERFVAASHQPMWAAPLPIDREWRCAYAALFLLEDLRWYVDETLGGPYRRPSTGLVLYSREAPALAKLFATGAEAAI